MATLVKKTHQSKYIQLLLFENVNVGLPAEGHCPNSVPNTHVEGKMPLEINAPATTTHTLLDDVKPPKSAWEYYNEATEIVDRERCHVRGRVRLSRGTPKANGESEGDEGFWQELRSAEVWSSDDHQVLYTVQTYILLLYENTIESVTNRQSSQT